MAVYCFHSCLCIALRQTSVHVMSLHSMSPECVFPSDAWSTSLPVFRQESTAALVLLFWSLSHVVLQSVSVTERHGTILSDYRPPTVVRHAVQATSTAITDTSAGRPPVAVCNCRRSSLRHCWCSVVEQFASRHCYVRHTSSVPPRT